MRLLGTGTSPYARIVRMQILSRRLTERISVEPIATRVESSPLHAFNPTGKIPTLVLDDGTAFSEARLICTYLDTLHDDTPFVHSVEVPEDRAIEGIAVGCLDGVAVWVREVRRPENERSPSILQQEAWRAERCLGWLEENSSHLRSANDYAMCAIAVALDRLAFSVPEFEWRDRYPKMSAWLDMAEARPEFSATAPSKN